MVDFISLLYVIFMPRVSLPGRYGSATRYKKRPGPIGPGLKPPAGSDCPIWWR